MESKVAEYIEKNVDPETLKEVETLDLQDIANMSEEQLQEL